MLGKPKHMSYSCRLYTDLNGTKAKVVPIPNIPYPGESRIHRHERRNQGMERDNTTTSAVQRCELRSFHSGLAFHRLPKHCSFSTIFGAKGK